jgi:hypothetical protein
MRLIFGRAIGLIEAASRDAMAAFVFSGIARGASVYFMRRAVR